MTGSSILFIEDEGPLLMLIGDALADEGFDIACAPSGAAALAMLAGDRRYDFIISDVSMPGGVSGIDIARRASDLQPQASVVLTSGHSRAQLPPLPEHVRFLPKPYRIGQLLQVLADRPPSR